MKIICQISDFEWNLKLVVSTFCHTGDHHVREGDSQKALSPAAAEADKEEGDGQAAEPDGAGGGCCQQR